MILELGQSLSSFEWIRVTAEYSNAVLVALLPYVNNVAQKLDLPVPQPVTVQNVIHCSIVPQRKLTAEIGIEGKWFFQFDTGYVRIIQGPREFFTMQDPERVPEFFGKVRMTKSEAIQLARNTLKRLDIPLESVFAEQEPRVTEPIIIGTNVVPHYRIEWLRPTASFPSVDIDVDAEAKQIARIQVLNKSLERPPPKINVVPPRNPDSPYWPSCNPEYAWKLIPIVLLAIEEYGQKLSLPVPRPLTTNHVTRFSLADNGGWPHCEIDLTNGWRLIYRNSMVNGYYAPNNLFNSDNRQILVREFSGNWNVTELEAIALVKRAIARLNYDTNHVHIDFSPRVIRPSLSGIPRYLFSWQFEENQELSSKVEAEVDADKRQLKSLYYDDKAYWNRPPLIEVSIVLPQKTINNNMKGIHSQNGTSTKSPPRNFTPMRK